MKKSYLITSICLSLLFSKGEAVFAQTVTIPDTNFAVYLHTIIPSAISGNQLDTGSSVVKHLTYISVMLKHISSLEGIQYFTSLTYLECSWNNLTSLPALPNSLIYLGCATNSLTSLPVLPNSLQALACEANSLTSLPALPNTLKRLNCSVCSLTVLPSLPNTLKQLVCGGNSLTNLPTLPNSLDTLTCPSSLLTSLPALPSTLTLLWCSYNKLTNLPALPTSIRNIECEGNQLTSLPALPDSIQFLRCINNKITCFPYFPNSLSTYTTGLIISGNPFTCLPNYITAMNSTLLAYPLCSLDNTSGCPASTDVPTNIIIPNIFTPNGDSINDTFFVKGANLTNFSCKIYDRWGALLYQWTDINAGWSGKDKNGAASNDGTYYYVITYTDNTGKANTKNGFFQLLK